MRHDRIRLAAWLLFLVCVSTSCAGWRATKLDPIRLVEEERPRRIRVTTLDSARFTIEAPRIRGDSLVSIPNPATSVAVREILQVEVEKGWVVVSALVYVVIPFSLLAIWAYSP